MTDKRVAFDFEVVFSNGGGIQGQGFRLDIPGDEIDDEALAAYIIRDLRLLMVDSLRILKKTIITEPHKRATRSHRESDGAGGSPGDRRVLDLSHTIEAGMTTYPGLPGPSISDHLSRQASRESYEKGTEFQIGRIDMVGNTGTYVDVPFHRFEEGADLASVHIDRLAGIPGVVVDVSGARGRDIDWQHFAAVDCRGRAVLIRTGWDRHWGTKAYFSLHPHLTEQAAVYLRDHGAVLVGIDSLNIDSTEHGTRPVHSVLLAAGIPVVEHLTRLNTLPADDFRFTAAPPAIAGMGTFPVRAHAVVGSAA